MVGCLRREGGSGSSEEGLVGGAQEPGGRLQGGGVGVTFILGAEIPTKTSDLHIRRVPAGVGLIIHNSIVGCPESELFN